MTSNKIDEILDLNSAGIKRTEADLFERFFEQQDKNLKFILKWRLIISKIVWTKFIFFFYLYNNALDYFIEKRLKLPWETSYTFGTWIGSLLSDQGNQIYLYVLLGLWLTLGL